MDRMTAHAHRIEAPLPPGELAARWRALSANPIYAEVAGKIELTEWGEVVMTPVGKSHGLLAARAANLLQRALGGHTMLEVGVATAIGVRAPDVLWCSDGWLAAHPEEMPLSAAPELCVEVASPSNALPVLREKALAYVNAGAVEAWVLFPEKREVEIYGRDGRRQATSFKVDLGALFDV